MLPPELRPVLVVGVLRLSRLTFWSFGIFVFVISYAVVLYLLVALLFPDSISEYAGYEDFFIKRRRWFFGLLATTFVSQDVLRIRWSKAWNTGRSSAATTWFRCRLGFMSPASSAAPRPRGAPCNWCWWH